jgi:hypothetical protein
MSGAAVRTLPAVTETCASAAQPISHWERSSGGQRSLRLETIVKITDDLYIDAGKLVSKLPVPSD